MADYFDVPASQMVVDRETHEQSVRKAAVFDRIFARYRSEVDDYGDSPSLQFAADVFAALEAYEPSGRSG
jgi:hypothetical protein